MPMVLIADAMSPRAAEIFADRGIEVDVIPGMSPDQLAAKIGGYEGLALRSATSSACGLISTAVILAPGMLTASATAILPLPVPRSRMRAFPGARAMASSTRTRSN